MAGRLAAMTALGAGSVAAFVTCRSSANSQRNPVQLTLDAKHTDWLASQQSTKFPDPGAVLQGCIAEAKRSDPDVVFGTARCVGGKKQKVRQPIRTIDFIMFCCVLS